MTPRDHEAFSAEGFSRLLKEKQHAYKRYAWDIRTSDANDDANDADDEEQQQIPTGDEEEEDEA